MRNILSLGCNEDGFYIETISCSLNNLRISSQGKIQFFRKVDLHTWYISNDQIAQILTNGKEDRAYIYHGDLDEQLSIADFEVNSINEKLMNHYEDQTIYLYFTNDGYLRIIWNQCPSARSYFISSQITALKQIDDTSLDIEITLHTKIFPAVSCELLISNRKEKIESSNKPYRFTTKIIEPNHFCSKINIQINPSDIYPRLMPNYDYHDYSLIVFDYWLTFQINQQSITSYKFRLSGPESHLDTMWFEKSENMLLALTWYKTSIGNLSNRASILAKQSAQMILTQTENNSIIKKIDKPIVLVVEYPYKAQENGLYFFKYLMENQNDVIPYYIISENSSDLDKLESYMSNVVFYKSEKHVKLFYQATAVAHTHTPNYVLPIYINETVNHLKNVKKLFLQHGIMGFRDLEYLYGRKSHPELIDKFVVSSPREFAVVRDELFYPESDIGITGLARFDELLKGNTFSKRWTIRKNVLIMPTWRKGQENLTDSAFLKTTFYRAFEKLINDSILEKLAKKYDLKISFYLHNNFQRYRHLFKSNFVKIISADETTVQKLLKENGVLITDFSSVGLDFAIQNRPVLYYQFPEKLKDQRDAEQSVDFLPGPIFENSNQLISELTKKVRLNTLDRKYRKLVRSKIYAHNDKKACNRIFMLLKDMLNIK